MSEDVTRKVDLHHKLLLGDPERLWEQPGLIVEHARTSEEFRAALRDANKTLSEIRNVGIWVFGIILTGFLTAVMTLVYRGH